MTGKIDDDIKKLVLCRIDASVPKYFKLSIGSEGTFDREELKKHVENEDDIGLQVVEMQLDFIKNLANGNFSKVLAE